MALAIHFLTYARFKEVTEQSLKWPRTPAIQSLSAAPISGKRGNHIA